MPKTPYTRIYNRFTGYSAADCDCKSCMYYRTPKGKNNKRNEAGDTPADNVPLYITEQNATFAEKLAQKLAQPVGCTLDECCCVEERHEAYEREMELKRHANYNRHQHIVEDTIPLCLG